MLRLDQNWAGEFCVLTGWSDEKLALEESASRWTHDPTVGQGTRELSRALHPQPAPSRYLAELHVKLSDQHFPCGGRLYLQLQFHRQSQGSTTSRNLSSFEV